MVSHREITFLLALCTPDVKSKTLIHNPLPRNRSTYRHLSLHGAQNINVKHHYLFILSHVVAIENDIYAKMTVILIAILNAVDTAN